MGIGLALIHAFGNRDRHDAIADRRGRDIAEIADELPEPQFQIEPRSTDEIGTAGTHEILRRWLVTVNFRAGPRDGHDLGRIATHVLGAMSAMMVKVVTTFNGSARAKDGAARTTSARSVAIDFRDMLGADTQLRTIRNNGV